MYMAPLGLYPVLLLYFLALNSIETMQFIILQAYFLSLNLALFPPQLHNPSKRCSYKIHLIVLVKGRDTCARIIPTGILDGINACKTNFLSVGKREIDKRCRKQFHRWKKKYSFTF